MDYYGKRITKFQKSMKCSYSVLFSDDYNSNVFYFAGFKGTGILIIPKKGRATIFASNLDFGNIKNKSLNRKVFDKNIKDEIRKIIKKGSIIGFDFSTLSINLSKYLKKMIRPKKPIDVSKILIKQRATKDSYEINQIRKACSESCDILAKCLKHIHNFKHEYGIKNYIESEIKRRGLDLAFDTIVASGKNAANPHYSSCKDKLRRGFLVIDFGAKVDGYCADMTRTLFLGKPTQKEKDVYNKVLTVQKTSINMLNKNPPINKVDEYARKELGKHYIHSLGHGVGLDIHEYPRISVKNKEKLENNICFTIEPGIYNKFGIRIEDTMIKLNNKIKILTPFTKGLITINNKVYK